jgi:hypothetical protein
MAIRFESERFDTQIIEVPSNESTAPGITILNTATQYEGFYPDADQALVKFDKDLSNLKLVDKACGLAVLIGIAGLPFTMFQHYNAESPNTEQVNHFIYFASYIACISSIAIGYLANFSIERDIYEVNDIMNALREFRLRDKTLDNLPKS